MRMHNTPVFVSPCPLLGVVPNRTQERISIKRFRVVRTQRCSRMCVQCEQGDHQHRKANQNRKLPRPAWVRVAKAALVLTSPLIVAAGVMVITEGWTVLDGLYFATTVATTVGYVRCTHTVSTSPSPLTLTDKPATRTRRVT